MGIGGHSSKQRLLEAEAAAEVAAAARLLDPLRRTSADDSLGGSGGRKGRGGRGTGGSCEWQIFFLQNDLI